MLMCLLCFLHQAGMLWLSSVSQYSEARGVKAVCLDANCQLVSCGNIPALLQGTDQFNIVSSYARAPMLVGRASLKAYGGAHEGLNLMHWRHGFQHRNTLS